MMQHEIVKIEHSGHDPYDNIAIFDSDGDGTSAAAIWLMDKPGTTIAITNVQKSQRNLARQALNLPSFEDSKIGVFDLAAEDNHAALEALRGYGSIDYVDHHTRDPSLVPASVFNYIRLDTCENCTATLSFDLAKERGVLEDPSNLVRATQLVIVGLANDGKGRASLCFGDDLVSPDERAMLRTYAQALNYGSASGESDGVEILDGFVNSETPLFYLETGKLPNELTRLRDAAMQYLDTHTQVQSVQGISLYQLPWQTPNDCLKSEHGYNEFMNARMQQDTCRTHVGLVQTSDGNYTFSVRASDGTAYQTTDNIAALYGKTALGRDTAAGFSTDAQVKRSGLLEKIIEAQK